MTRIDSRSVEQPVNLDDDDDVYNYPFLYAVQVGQWDLTRAQAAKLRDFILRGGFFMGDDFWGTYQWETFEASMNRVFPESRPFDLNETPPFFTRFTIWTTDIKFLACATYIQVRMKNARAARLNGVQFQTTRGGSWWD